MTSSIPLGRILGIRVGINWSWLVVFALIAWTLATGIFPETNPGLGHGTYVWMAIVASILFFASLLLHELGHAVQARREGMEIEGITLWLFGGVAKFKGMFPSAGPSSGSRSPARSFRWHWGCCLRSGPGPSRRARRSTAWRPGSATST